MENLTFVEIFTDGACSGNPGPGGWVLFFAVMVLKKNFRVVKKKPQTTEWNYLQLLTGLKR